MNSKLHYRPGVYFDVPFEEYCAIDAVNMSRLKRMAWSPRHYKYQRPEPEQRESLVCGSLIHTATLEPLEILKHYVVEPRWRDHADNCDASGAPSTGHTKWVKEKHAEFLTLHEGKQLVTAEQYESAVCCTQSVARNRAASELLWDRTAQAEVTIVWDDADTGIRCKGRIDWLASNQGQLVDLKTAVDFKKFRRSYADLRYYMQMAFYMDGYATLTGEILEPVIIAVERTPPHCVQCAPVCEEDIQQGRSEYAKLLAKLQVCLSDDDWPGPEDPESWQLPSWAKTKEEPVEVTIGGVKLSV
jgi:hypothetical protein